jgi:hypothetical protein
MKYILGIIAIIVGFIIVWKSTWLVNNVGRIGWADEHLGAEGGSNLFYKLMGLLLIIGTFMVLTGALPALLSGIFGSSFGPNEQINTGS